MALTDHRTTQERWARDRARRRDLPRVFGDFISRVAVWSWFLNPITFRKDPHPIAALKAIEEWLGDLQAYVGSRRIGWVVAEEFGPQGGRWHCHGLVSGVDEVDRSFWWREAFRRFGRTAIHPFDPKRAAAFYAAKYAAKTLGGIHFGGTLAGTELSQLTRSQDGRRTWKDSLSPSSLPMRTHGLVAVSAELPKEYYRLGLSKWHR